jgi:shikimate dehydrogenase
MIKAAVIGWPIEHSRSPMIHGYWLDHYKIDGSYSKIAVRPEEVATFFDRLADRGLAGCNVTVPHKEAAFRAAAIREPSAEAVGAANTLWLEGDRLHAANSDTYGYMAHLDASAPDWRDRDGPVAILGAGGTARAIAYGFLSAGVEDVRIVARTVARADEIARQLGRGITVVPWAERDRIMWECRLVANTTTLGMNGVGAPDLDFLRFRRNLIITDAVYTPLETPFLARARECGLQTVDGLGMLLHQAVLGFSKWFGVVPEVTDVLRDLIVRDIEGR